MNTVKKIDFLIELANRNENSLIEKELKTIRRQLAREKMQISYFIKNLIWFLEEETVTEKIDFELFSIMYKNFMHHDLLTRLYELDWKLNEQ
jgi:hypothetical protein